jgi:uncharacterized cupin superfamily protein
VTPILRGRLSSAADAPARGERATELARMGNVVVEQILSGRLDGPVDDCQAQAEWVVFLEGGAVLEVGGERVDLVAGDWVLLPAGVPHRLVETTPGTSWLAVHVHPED